MHNMVQGQACVHRVSFLYPNYCKIIWFEKVYKLLIYYWIFTAEGSWIQGGSRTASGAVPVTSAGPGNGNTPAGQGLPLNIPVSGGHTQEGPGGGRQNLGQSPNMVAGPAGQHNSVNNQGSAPSSGSHQIGPNLHHYRGLIPPFVSLLSQFRKSELA